jgi:hypothetical protein
VARSAVASLFPPRSSIYTVCLSQGVTPQYPSFTTLEAFVSIPNYPFPAARVNLHKQLWSTTSVLSSALVLPSVFIHVRINHPRADPVHKIYLRTPLWSLYRLNVLSASLEHLSDLPGQRRSPSAQPQLDRQLNIPSFTPSYTAPQA